MEKKHHESTLKRMAEIRKLASELYEDGNQSKCYAAIWRSRIQPLYGVCYRTFLHYVNTPEENNTPENIDSQLKLFDDEKNTQ